MASALLPRSSPTAAGLSSSAIHEFLDRLDARGIECHSLMVVRGGAVVAEGWWAPYAPEHAQLLYSVTKSFTSVAVGLAIADGLLALDDRVIDVLPEHVPADAPAQARRLTVHHLLSMTTGHGVDTLGAAWESEPHDLVKGFLQHPFVAPEGTLHTYDNATTFVLARMVERVTGVGLPEFLDARLFHPMGITDAEWDRVGSGAAFGFHGLHLRTESVAAFGVLLRQRGRWGEEQLIPADWVDLATRSHISSRHYGAEEGIDFQSGYGYQFWIARYGFHANGAFGQHCVVVPSHDLVVVLTCAQETVQQAQDVLDAIRECLLPGVGVGAGAEEDARLERRLRALSLTTYAGDRGPGGAATASMIAALNSALPEGMPVVAERIADGCRVRFGDLLAIDFGSDDWIESLPLDRPVAAIGCWRGDVFTGRIFVLNIPHRLDFRLDAAARTAVCEWHTVPLTTLDLVRHLRTPLMTRPEVS